MRQPDGEVAAEWVDIDSLKVWDENPRNNDEAIAPTMESIRRFGFAAPIVARRADREIIAGHTRHEAARRLGLRKVPVRFVDLDESEAHLLAIGDNKLGEIADWNTAEVLSILRDYSPDACDVAGFDQAEIERLSADLAREVDPPEPGYDEGGGAAAKNAILHFNSIRILMTDAEAARIEELFDDPPPDLVEQLLDGLER